MTKRCSIRESEKQLSELVREAERGECIELTRNGDPVAVLIPVEEFKRLTTAQPVSEPSERESFSKSYREFLEKYPIEEYGYDEGTFENLRDPTPGREVDF